MSFLDDYDALNPEQKVPFILQHIVSQPDSTFAELRSRRPILISPGPVVVTLFHDVTEILQRHDDFSVRLYEPKMVAITGPFFLGEDSTPLYERDTSVMRLAMRRSDLDQIKSYLRRRASELLSEANGTIEIVQKFTRQLSADLMDEYLGLGNPDRSMLLRWARELFRDIFTNLANDPDIHRKALEEAKTMRMYIDELICKKSCEKQRGDTIVDRLIALQCADGLTLNNESIRHNLIGIIAGAIETTSKCVVHILDQLFDRPAELAICIAAAKTDDVNTLEAYCFEALRFKPHNPMLVRFSEKDAVIAAGTQREVIIPKGKVVFVATSSAMMDQGVLQEPDKFRVDRPDYTNLHFGFGLHTCFGRHINRVQIVEQIKALLLLPGIKRASGDAGKIKYDGPFPDAFHVQIG